MNRKTRAFTPHAIMHGVFGLGLGLLLAAPVPALRVGWLGIVLMVVAFALDATRPG
jgi:hypothetical protein